MKHDQDELIPTRASLLHRLKNWQDESSWQEFFNIYWKLVYGVARKAGMSYSEAQDVLQETLISVAKHMPTFEYDPSIGSFKTWLLNMTRWRIIAQFRNRQPIADPGVVGSATRSDPLNALTDPNGLDLDAMWEAEWQSNLLHAAMENLRRRIDSQRFQIFDFNVNKEWPSEKVAKRFGVPIEQVYQIKYRVTEALRAEVIRLEKEVT